ncbi:unnamed protein product, partial [Mesorhabditis belari]|uniref:Polyprotein allergen nematode domain-containing protein n=1 Tax=Mesorhabditis belari TaxID=2138241 RepID=A0AAF3JC09_9BILA
MRSLLVLPLLVCLASAASVRVRRDHHEGHEAHDYSVDTLIAKVLPWLSEEQKTTLKGLENDKDALLTKVEEYFKGHDKKGEAADQLIKACKHIITDAIGDENASQIKKLKESGAGLDAIEAKVDTFLEAATDSEAKKVAVKVKPSCKKVFQWKHAEAATAAAARVRRDHHEGHEAHDYSVDTLIAKVLPWLSEEQKTTLKGLENDKDALLTKVEEYFKGHDKKGEAADQLIKACKHIITDAIGDENASQIKKLKESGAGLDAVEAKVDTFLEAATDSEAKKVALKVKPSCKKVFQWKHAEAAATAGRKRREVTYNLDLALDKVLTWLSAEQKTALKALENDKDALFKKVDEYFQEISGDSKKEAVNKVKEACKHIFGTAIGEEKVGEVKKLKEAGASYDDIEKKVGELLEAAAASPAKTTAEQAKPWCTKAFKWQATQ